MNTYRILLVLFMLITLGQPVRGQITSAQSGSWTDPATWVGGVVPDTADNVVLGSADTITISTAAARCNNISFTDTACRIAMASGSVLSVYGNFTIAATSHKAFVSWASGAKVRFAGYAANQLISGFNTAGSSTSFAELQIDKPTGRVTTPRSNMRLSFADTLDVIQGTFHLDSLDDIESRTLGGTGTAGIILVRSGATFSVNAGASHMRRGTFTDSVTSRMGKLIVYGTASLTTTSTNRINFEGIDIENGGVLNLQPSGNTGLLNCNFVNIKSGGTLINNTTTTLYHSTAYVIVQSGGEFESTTSTTPLPSLGINVSAGTIRFSRSGTQTLPAAIPVYYNLIFSGSGAKTLGVNTTVNGTFSMRGSSALALGAFTLTYGGSSVLQYGSSGQTTAQTTSDAEWPVSGGPGNITCYNSGGVTLHDNRTVTGTLTLSAGSFDNNGALDDKTLTMSNGSLIRRATGSITSAPAFGASVNVEYYSTVSSVTASHELPSASGVLNNLTISGNKGVTLAKNITVNGALAVQNSNITTDTFKVILASTGTISESASYGVVGNLEVTRTLAQAVNETFGGAGAEVNAAGAAPGVVTLLRKTGTALSGMGGQSIKRSFQFSPAVNTGLNAVVVLFYKTNELNGIPESKLTGVASSNGGASWAAVTGTADSNANSYSLSGIASLSLFTLANSDSLTPASFTLTITALIEGLYDGSTSVPDTLTVVLRNNSAPYAQVASATALFNSSGVGTLTYTGIANGTPYLLQVLHRSALETWSAAGQSFSGNALSYDFSTAANQAYGDNQVLKAGKYCLYSGDVNQDGLIDLNDLIAIDNDNANFEYHIANDVNMDLLVDLNDMILVDNNNAAFIGKLTPSMPLRAHTAVTAQ